MGVAPGVVALRPETAADDALLAALYGATRAAELAALPWSAAQKADFLQQQHRLRERHYRAHFAAAAFDVIEEDGRPVGRLCLWRGAREWRVVDIALLPECRGRGIGSALLRRVLAEADTAGAAVSLHVEPASPACRLYGRLGFQAAGGDGFYLAMRRSAVPPGAAAAGDEGAQAGQQQQ
ncbi:GNAT family N-acetyltransferase [Azohydromonas aeria]|uniref:GNAT family N-acetyltransferase n=1 Tax=Azohydromonas aeria TaxID=2590212 RepID=UPI0012FCAE9A|nr:GNAT family N-acetyltransferase [Azohydromonas aeria]